MRHGFLSLVIAAMLVCSPGARLHGQTPEPALPGTPVVIVELFTSEGCSSCPPADRLLGRVHLRQAPSGQLIVGISEHVTYWNQLGWRDPYSADIFTERQETYADRLSAQGPYTPQMVVNGRVQFAGGDAPKLDRALKEDAARSHATLAILARSLDGNTLNVRFKLGGTAHKPLEIVAVVTDDADTSSVLRGENSGRTLSHTSVARVLTRVSTMRDDGEQSGHVTLPSTLTQPSGHHLILFAQEPRQGAIVAAAVTPL